MLVGKCGVLARHHIIPTHLMESLLEGFFDGVVSIIGIGNN